MSLESLNTMTHQQAIDWFALTCTASKWCEKMANSRPYMSLDSVNQTAQQYWQSMLQEDVMEAFAGHPMIGDLASLKAKYSNTKMLAKNEQGGMASASEDVFIKLKALNEEYLSKHGFIFIICASGLSAEQMLNAISVRVGNSTEEEVSTAAGEQLKITQLRITKALSEQQPSE